MSPDSEFWLTQIPPTKQSSHWHHVPWDKNTEIIQAHLLIQHSKEELSLIMEEELNVLEYWAGVKITIDKYLVLCSSEQTQTPYLAGSSSLLRKYLVEAEHYQTTTFSLFDASLPPTDRTSYEESDSDLDSLSDCVDY